MKKVKAKLTKDVINICKCGRKVTMKRWYWLHELEDINTLSSQEKERAKFKARLRYMGICLCGVIFLVKK